MTIEFKKDRYFTGIWFGNLFPDQDFMGAMYKEGNDWVIKYRFRYIVDDKIFDSDDTKSWYTLIAKENQSENEIKEMFEFPFTMVREAAKKAGIDPDEVFKFYPIYGDGYTWLEEMTKEDNLPPFMHAKHMTQQEAEEEGYVERLH